nr:hypothetical protein [Budvicia aquatica]
MQLEKHFEQSMASISANKEIAREQADVLAAALSKTNIDIVGGDGSFFNTFSKALSVGKAINGVVEKSPVVQDVVQKLMGAGKDGQKLDIEALLQNPEVLALIQQLTSAPKPSAPPASPALPLAAPVPPAPAPAPAPAPSMTED